MAGFASKGKERSEELRRGNINCECGQTFYFETVNTQIDCIRCGKAHNVSAFPIKEEPPAEEGDPDGTDI